MLSEVSAIPDPVPGSKEHFHFSTPSNLLARALHGAVIGADTVSGDSQIKLDLKLTFQLLELATPEEIAEAQRCMRQELGYDLHRLEEILTGESKQRLARILRGTLREDNPGREFLFREFERANIFPKKQIPSTVEEKLILLGDYLRHVRDGAEQYPEIIERWEQLGKGEGHPECPLWISRSIRLGVWAEFGREARARDIIREAQPKIQEAAEAVRHYQNSLDSIDAEGLRKLIENLDVVNRFAIDFAMDLCEDAYLTFSQVPPQNMIQRILGSKPIEACEAAFSVVFRRYFLVKRAVGVREFVDHMRDSLERVNGATRA